MLTSMEYCTLKTERERERKREGWERQREKREGGEGGVKETEKESYF